MSSSIDDQVLEFYGQLFDSLFSEPFREKISERRKRNEVIRHVETAADAASSSLTRFFLNQQLSEAEAACILTGLAKIDELLKLEDIDNPNIPTETTVENLLKHLSCPLTVEVKHGAVYRLALYTLIQVLLMVGPVMAEWQNLNFSNTFELPRKVVSRLNEISDQINAQGHSGQAGADERYELMHRDYLLQRFHKVEAGTVRMTTNLDVDLRTLFVMPRVVVRKLTQEIDNVETDTSISLMSLAAARQLYKDKGDHNRTLPEEISRNQKKQKQACTALEQIKNSPRNVIVGLPGAGKSTFFEWLQVKLASVEETLILQDQQAIPLLLRVRQLDLHNLPRGAALIEKATASKDRATVMPNDWIERQMTAGRVLFMLDGLDETEPELRDKYLMPWLFDLLKRYPKCHYLISSRPVGYTFGLLKKQKFVECDLLDFNETQISEYTHHWCTAVRLARNESEAEARREGKIDGQKIVKAFQGHPYIRNLARNPLMLSAICLVNYFEGGNLPDDRALLYRLCVEGLLHNWDQRRGIDSQFGFDEKLRACREVALAMQMQDEAECDANKVQEIFTKVLHDAERATNLLEHIRYRTGLLLERRPGVFGFAHLTFQEYLAARAVHEGNQLGVTVEQLVKEHDDGRWKEVIALYCGLAVKPSVRDLIEKLISQPDTESLAEVLTEAYFAGGSELLQDINLRQRVIERVAVAPVSFQSKPLDRFPQEEVVPKANNLLGAIKSNIAISESHRYLNEKPQLINMKTLREKMQFWQNKNPFQLGEICHLVHKFAHDEILIELANKPEFYCYKGATFKDKSSYYTQAEIAIIGLFDRDFGAFQSSDGFYAVLCIVIQTLIGSKKLSSQFLYSLDRLFIELNKLKIFNNLETSHVLVVLARKMSKHLKTVKLDRDSINVRERAIEALENWADTVEGIQAEDKMPSKPAPTKPRINRRKSR